MTGATGQDGYFLVRRLLDDGWTVHAPVRDVAAAERLFAYHDGLHAVRRDLVDPGPLAALVGDIRPEEMYNLAGESSVAGSFANPRANWEANAHVIVHLLDAIRNDSPETRFYQASSGEMFGWVPGGQIVHDELSPLNPQSPYAAAKAAAHLLCRSYRESYDVRIACGILFNHESHRRGQRFLTRKVVDHVDALRRGAVESPLRVGNLKARRDWGFAPDYVEGMMMILRQTSIRGVADVSAQYQRLCPRHWNASPRVGADRSSISPRWVPPHLGSRRRRSTPLAGDVSKRAMLRSLSTPSSFGRPIRRRSVRIPRAFDATWVGSRASASTSSSRTCCGWTLEPLPRRATGV